MALVGVLTEVLAGVLLKEVLVGVLEGLLLVLAVAVVAMDLLLWGQADILARDVADAILMVLTLGNFMLRGLFPGEGPCTTGGKFSRVL